MRIAAMVFPFVLWFMASFFFLGEIGKYSDDWSIDLRRPDTGQYHWPDSPFERWNYFWRPLHLILIHSLGTFAWEQDWLRHLVNAALHGVVVWMLYGFMRRIEISKPIAAAGALIALTHPAVYEMVLWPSTVSALVATVMLLAMWGRALRIGEGTHRPPACAWVVPIVWGAWTFVMACFYEQQAGVAPLCGLVALAGRAQPWPREGWRRAISRAIQLGIGPALACVVYIGLLITTAPADTRGGSRNLRSPVDAASSLAACAERAWDWIAGPRIADAAAGAFVHARSILLTGAGLATVGIALLSGMAWLAWWFTRADRDCDCETRRCAEHDPRDLHGAPGIQVRDFVLLVVFIAGAVLSLVPTALVSQTPPQLRLIYLPLLFVILGVSLVVDRLAAAWVPRRVSISLRWPVGVVVVCASIIGSIALIGYQDAFRRRSRLDLHQLAQLKALIPNPPSNAVFMPVRLDARAVSTGHPRFDLALPGAANLPWASWAWLQGRDGYMRRDIVCTNIREGTKPSYRNVTEEGFRYTPNWTTPPPYVPRGGRFIPWASCIPFVVERDNTVRLVRVLSVPGVETTQGQTLTVPFPQIESLRSGLADDRFTEATLTGTPVPKSETMPPKSEPAAESGERNNRDEISRP